MVKNYLVSAVRPIRTVWMNREAKELHEKYLEMYEMSVASFRRWVEEPFEAVLWTEPADDNEQYTMMNWQAIRDLWQSEPCNIFWAGADTIMIQSTSLFSDRFPEYRLFNYTEPKTIENLEHYYNDDLQYYPSTMSQETWNLGEKFWELRENHPQRRWGFDQIRHNAMFWSQDIPAEDRLHPKLAYQAFATNFAMDGDRENIKSLRHFEYLDNWNGVDVKSAHILHFHASRGPDQVISIMKHLCPQIGITV